MGGLYRTGESVDIIASKDAAGGGYVVGYFTAGEWLAYTVNVPTSGLYDISIRAANNDLAAGSFHVEVDGVNVTGSITVPVTGSWSAFQSKPDSSRKPTMMMRSRCCGTKCLPLMTFDVT